MKRDNLRNRQRQTKAVKVGQEKLQGIGKSIPDGWQYCMNVDDLPEEWRHEI